MRFLPRLLRRVVRRGRLTVIGPDGARHVFGAGDGPSATVRLLDPSLDWRLAFSPELTAAEAWMDGRLAMEEGEVYDLLAVFFANKRSFRRTGHRGLARRIVKRFRRALTHNTLAASLRNARAHYDIGDDLYRAMLDRDMQYSCGYWPEGVSTLEEAQTAKKRHIAAKLRVEPGSRVLDIGCGWGGTALYLAAACDAEVLGVTLSEDQLRVARARAEAAGLADRVRFELRDYREVEGPFDRIVSVGMLEHVGVGQLPVYFRRVREMLGEDGVALVHSISGRGSPGVTSAFIRKHVFPGGYSPRLSETAAAIEASGLWMLDVELWRVHYAETLNAWRRNFMAARDALPPRYDDRFKRMWEFYLSSSEAAFRIGDSLVMQLQLGRERDAAPLTRDYVEAEARRLAAAEADFLPGLLGSTERAFGR